MAIRVSLLARLLLLAVALTFATRPAFAWVYPEHRDITLLSIEGLDPERKALFDWLWAEARIDHEKRLCAQGTDTAQGVMPECIDWAALPAIGGDHSCTSKQLLDTVNSATQDRSVAGLENGPRGSPQGRPDRRSAPAVGERSGEG
jgi:hypothetical protein